MKCLAGILIEEHVSEAAAFVHLFSFITPQTATVFTQAVGARCIQE